MIPELYRVRSRRREVKDTVTLTLETVNAPEPPRFAPGQFCMLYAPGVGEIPISLSGDPDRSGGLVFTIRNVGAVSRALSRLRKGDLLGVRGPFGHPWPIPVRGDVLVVAGGLGLAPLRPALYQLERQRARYGRVSLVYGARRPEEVLFPRLLERWKKRLEVEITVDRASSGWSGHVGLVTHLLPRVEIVPTRTLALVCGPEIMMRFVAESLLERGLPAQSILLSMERNMHCAEGTCGHCQFGPVLVCRDGPVLPYDRLAPWLKVSQL